MLRSQSCVYFLTLKNNVDLLSIIKNIGTYNKFGIKELNATREAICQYPYFQIGYTIIAKQDQSSESIEKAAIYATNCSYLKALLDCKTPFEQCLLDEKNMEFTPKPQKEEAHDCYDEIVSQDAPLYFVNGYIEDIFKRPPNKIIKQKNRLQYATISRFIKSNIKFQPKPVAKENLYLGDLQAYEHLKKDHINLTNDLATERLALILLDQGKVEAALDVYEKIIINYPHRKQDVNLKMEILKQNK